MALVKCRNCSTQLSANARTCPNCGQKTKPVRFQTCRACSTPLDPSVYAASHWASSIKDGTTTGRYVTIHTPCPKCGEREPLAATWETPFGKFVVYVVVPVMLLIAFWQWVGVKLGFPLYSYPSTAAGWGLVLIPSFVLYCFAAMISLALAGIFERMWRN